MSLRDGGSVVVSINLLIKGGRAPGPRLLVPAEPGSVFRNVCEGEDERIPPSPLTPGDTADRCPLVAVPSVPLAPAEEPVRGPPGDTALLEVEDVVKPAREANRVREPKYPDARLSVFVTPPVLS